MLRRPYYFFLRGCFYAQKIFKKISKGGETEKRLDRFYEETIHLLPHLRYIGLVSVHSSPLPFKLLH